MERFFINQIDWQEGRASFLAVRHEVFVVEQGVPEELEEDGLDAECTQLLAVDECDDK
ncbi:MAG: hypothetical protein L3J39_04545 [Verrucomicrobiales bacterium]|nr:hypothetical protein [Verrucomicrobiales bacterium]